MNRYIIVIALSLAMLGVLIHAVISNISYKYEIYPLSKWVNPMVGADVHGHTFPGAVYPFGMVQLSPDTRLDGWDGCSGYHFSDSVIYGFSHTHLSGTGCSDYGDILLMPMVGKYSLVNASDDAGVLSYASVFSHESEKAEPGYYSVFLKSPEILAEMTTTARVGMHRYTFNKPGSRYMILDLKHRDVVLESGLTKVSDTRFTGIRRSSAWAQNQILYFAIDFSVPVKIVDIAYNDVFLEDAALENIADLSKICKFDSKYGVFAFEISDTTIKSVQVKVSLSQVSEAGAIGNLDKELPDWDFEAVRKAATQAWDNELSRIVVKGGSEEQQKVFYTALYHSFIHPSLATDVDGKYRGTDLQVHQTEDFLNYTVFSLWDTYRAVHPLFTIVQQKRSLDFIKTFLAQYQLGGQLPMWELSANETGCMIGYHAVPPMVDAYLKGIDDFDTELALKAMMARAEADELGKPDYIKYGFLPVEAEHESVSKTLEYAYNDWCIAIFAKAIGNDQVYQDYMTRCQAYRHLFDSQTGFMRPRLNGSFKEPFDPKEVDHNFTEANSWQYSFYVPHDILGLVELLGGEKAFETKLDELFSTGSETHGKDLKDISGLIGQYAHGNEPSHHIAYLYNYCRRPDKTQKMVRKIMAEMYNSSPSGNCGNEDCGQMSAWYVLSAMGFYPVNPANGVYDIGSPLFDTVLLQLENGKRFTIIAHNNSESNMYIEKILLNGRNYNKTYLLHRDIMRGGTLEFFMSRTPGKNFGKEPESVYPSKIDEGIVTRAPFTNVSKKTFHDSLVVELNCFDADARILYSTNEPANFKEYKKPLVLRADTHLFFYAEADGKLPSKPVKAEYIRIEGKRIITLLSEYSSLYQAGGDDALIDRLKGNDDFRSGDWQGFRAQDVVAVVDLGEILPVKSVETGFVQDQRSWIMMPLNVEYFFSNDGIRFVSMKKLTHNIPDNENNSVIHRFRYEPGNMKTRYVKVVAKYYGKLPKWHLGAGSDSWLFADEIEIITQ